MEEIEVNMNEGSLKALIGGSSMSFNNAPKNFQNISKKLKHNFFSYASDLFDYLAGYVPSPVISKLLANCGYANSIRTSSLIRYTLKDNRTSTNLSKNQDLTSNNDNNKKNFDFKQNKNKNKNDRNSDDESDLENNENRNDEEGEGSENERNGNNSNKFSSFDNNNNINELDSNNHNNPNNPNNYIQNGWFTLGMTNTINNPQSSVKQRLDNPNTPNNNSNKPTEGEVGSDSTKLSNPMNSQHRNYPTHVTMAETLGITVTLSSIIRVIRVIRVIIRRLLGLLRLLRL